MNEKQISETLFSHLKEYGAIKWHKNSSHSFYLKFKDTRLGSIRISNHNGRTKYRYTYEIYKDDQYLEKKIRHIIESVIAKSKTIRDFSPNKYIVYDKKNRRYAELPDFESYKKAIFKRK